MAHPIVETLYDNLVLPTGCGIISEAGGVNLDGTVFLRRNLTITTSGYSEKELVDHFMNQVKRFSEKEIERSSLVYGENTKLYYNGDFFLVLRSQMEEEVWKLDFALQFNRDESSA